MPDDPMIALLVALHEGLRRLGPGETAATLRALAACEGLPPRPRVLDLGCGAGAQTLDLLRATRGVVTALDLFPSFLDALREAAEAEGAGERLRTVAADMAAPPFEDGAFDLVWCEAAIYNVGFDAGLRAWRRLLAPGGHLVVSELCWLGDDPPEPLRAWWAREYPGLRGVEDNARAAAREGYAVRERFVLPESAWQAYHGPLAARLDPFLAARPGDALARELVQATRAEIELIARHHAFVGYVFFVLRPEPEAGV